MESISVLIDIAIPCGMVLNELISNSMKYAFPEKNSGFIKITLHRNNEGDIELTVSDNGVGIRQDFDFRNDSKLGMNTMIYIVENQLNGELNISNNNGVHFSIRFKDDLYKRRV